MLAALVGLVAPPAAPILSLLVYTQNAATR